MTEALLQHFNRLTIWQRRDERAPHKPLLALWALGQCLSGQSRLIEYNTIHNALLVLLRTFGPPRKRHKPQEPFWRMRKDQIWEVTQAHRIPEHSNGSVSSLLLRELNVLGGFPSSLYDAFRRDHALILMIAQQLVDAHFPETMRTTVLEATLGDYAFGEQLPKSTPFSGEYSPLLQTAAARRNRNPKFRKEVLRTYNYTCAVCDYFFEFPSGNWPALEAAHIRWHSHKGPDDPENGLSLCVLHHELFDWGVFTIEPDSLNISVSEIVHEQLPESAIVALHGTPMQTIPNRASHRPATEHLNWHARNVFRDR